MNTNMTDDGNELQSLLEQHMLDEEVTYKYNEGNILKEISQYIDATYDQHYSRNNFQATEFIIDGGHGTGFCIGNVLKYAQRYGHKGSPQEWRKDLMKVIHYTIIQLHIHDLESKEHLRSNKEGINYGN